MTELMDTPITEEVVESPELEGQPVVETPAEDAPPPGYEGLPKTYWGKTPAELAHMHEEAQREKDRLGTEVGKLRKQVDTEPPVDPAVEEQKARDERCKPDAVSFFNEYYEDELEKMTQREAKRLVRAGEYADEMDAEEAARLAVQEQAVQRASAKAWQKAYAEDDRINRRAEAMAQKMVAPFQPLLTQHQVSGFKAEIAQVVGTADHLDTVLQIIQEDTGLTPDTLATLPPDARAVLYKMASRGVGAGGAQKKQPASVIPVQSGTASAPSRDTSGLKNSPEYKAAKNWVETTMGTDGYSAESIERMIDARMKAAKKAGG